MTAQTATDPLQQPLRRGQPIWWNIAASRVPRPAYIPKSRDQQAGWVRELDGNNAAIDVMNEERKMETFIVPVDQLRARAIT